LIKLEEKGSPNRRKVRKRKQITKSIKEKGRGGRDLTQTFSL